VCVFRQSFKLEDAIGSHSCSLHIRLDCPRFLQVQIVNIIQTLKVNYDPPTHPRTYVHRAGRTARAGATGAVYTLLRRQEVRHFRELRKKVDSSKPAEYKLHDGDYTPFEARYEAALSGLQTAIESETKADPRTQAASLARALRSQQIRMRTPAVRPGAITLVGAALAEGNSDGSSSDDGSSSEGGSSSSEDESDDSDDGGGATVALPPVPAASKKAASRSKKDMDLDGSSSSDSDSSDNDSSDSDSSDSDSSDDADQSSVAAAADPADPATAKVVYSSDDDDIDVEVPPWA
jgi:superfamily II DNA/RNA helicase